MKQQTSAGAKVQISRNGPYIVSGGIARRVGAQAIVPFHYSPRYAGRSDERIAEARAAWSGSSVRPRAGPG